LERQWCVRFVFFGRVKISVWTTQIITGAQIPLSQLRNDAVDNLLGALSIAGHYVIPGMHKTNYGYILHDD
jgi:hypothetical protein